MTCLYDLQKFTTAGFAFPERTANNSTLNSPKTTSTHVTITTSDTLFKPRRTACVTTGARTERTSLAPLDGVCLCDSRCWSWERGWVWSRCPEGREGSASYPERAAQWAEELVPALAPVRSDTHYLRRKRKRQKSRNIPGYEMMHSKLQHMCNHWGEID